MSTTMDKLSLVLATNPDGEQTPPTYSGGNKTLDHIWISSSLLPLLTDKGDLERDALFWHYPNFAFHRDNRLGSAIRMGDYKLIEFFDRNEVELYNLREDLGEKKNLAAVEAGRVQEMRKRLSRWREKRWRDAARAGC